MGGAIGFDKELENYCVAPLFAWHTYNYPVAFINASFEEPTVGWDVCKRARMHQATASPNPPNSQAGILWSFGVVPEPDFKIVPT